MNKHGTVLSVNISRKKGTIKKPVSRATVNSRGIEDDAHAGSWHRQVSLLAREDIAGLEKKCGRKFAHGEFAENLTTSGIDVASLPIGERLRIGEVELEVTQIGKACHGARCAIYREVGKCIMPKRGIFTRVLKDGEIVTGMDIIRLGRRLKVAVITMSDRASAGEYADLSGPLIRASIERHCAGRHVEPVFSMELIPDEPDKLRSLIRRAVKDGAAAVFTTGGTGIGPRDIAPETIKPLLDRELPGIMEFIRVKYGRKNPAALLSRSVAGVIGNTLVYALPGSVKAVREYMTEVLKTFDHAQLMIKGTDAHQATDLNRSPQMRE